VAARIKKHPGGRPTDFKAEYPDLVYKFCLLGAIDTQLAEFFSVSRQTLDTWKKKHPKFLASMRRGREQADADVADALYHRAIGYSHTAVKIFGSNESRGVEKVPYIEHYPPDTAAASLWLRNRQPTLWRDKTDMTLSNPDGSNLFGEVVTAMAQATAREAVTEIKFK
jgi:hypothetical protein